MTVSQQTLAKWCGLSLNINTENSKESARLARESGRYDVEEVAVTIDGERITMSFDELRERLTSPQQEKTECPPNETQQTPLDSTSQLSDSQSQTTE